jgi:hypothetical protein
MPALNRVLNESPRLDSSSTRAIERLAADDSRQAVSSRAALPGTLAGLPHRASYNLLLLYEGVRRPAPRA